MFSAKMVGLEDTIAKLKALGSPQENAAIYREVLMEGGEELKVAVVERAPLNKWPITDGSNALPEGAIKEGIAVSYLPNDVEPMVAVGPNRATLAVARDVEYGHRMIYGGYSRETKPGSGKYRGPGKVAKRERVAAYPFLRPALEASGQGILDHMKMNLETKIVEKFNGR